jgi:hypothetical protein
MATEHVICIESKAFEALVDRLVSYIQKEHQRGDIRWLTTEQAMAKLNITSKTTLQNLRDSGKIRYTQPMKKVVLYDRDSISHYLESHAKNTF